MKEQTENSEKIAPIMLKYNADYPVILTNIRRACGPTSNKSANGYIKIFPGTAEKHIQIKSSCREQGYEFYSIKPATERPLKVVIKGSLFDHDVEDIKETLTEIGFSII